MNIKFSTYAKKSGLSQILVRMYHRGFDVSAKLDLFVVPSDWNEELQLTESSETLNEKLLGLKYGVLKKYNEDFVSGVIFDKKWLQNTISEVFNRPSNEDRLTVSRESTYLVDFSYNWLKNESFKWKSSHNKSLSTNLISQYKKTIDLLFEYEKFSNCKIVLKDLKIEDFYNFVNFLQIELKYGASTVERIIGRVKFFCFRCKESGIKISNDFTKRICIEKKEEIQSVYLTKDEIYRIYKLDLSNDDNLDNIKDAFLLGLFTGMRFSDYGKRLDISNFKDGFIKITTQKTGQRIVVPVHRVVSDIVKKRMGSLPRKVNLHDFNLGIRTICMLCNIDEDVYGSLFDSKTKRKKTGIYKKYQLISSHSARRGFATIYSGKLSENAICSILGWSNSQMLKVYNKTTQEEYALQLQKVWEEEG